MIKDSDEPKNKWWPVVKFDIGRELANPDWVKWAVKRIKELEGNKCTADKGKVLTEGYIHRAICDILVSKNIGSLKREKGTKKDWEYKGWPPRKIVIIELPDKPKE